MPSFYDILSNDGPGKSAATSHTNGLAQQSGKSLLGAAFATNNSAKRKRDMQLTFSEVLKNSFRKVEANRGDGEGKRKQDDEEDATSSADENENHINNLQGKLPSITGDQNEKTSTPAIETDAPIPPKNAKKREPKKTETKGAMNNTKPKKDTTQCVKVEDLAGAGDGAVNLADLGLNSQQMTFLGSHLHDTASPLGNLKQSAKATKCQGGEKPAEDEKKQAFCSNEKTKGPTNSTNATKSMDKETQKNSFCRRHKTCVIMSIVVSCLGILAGALGYRNFHRPKTSPKTSLPSTATQNENLQESVPHNTVLLVLLMLDAGRLELQLCTTVELI